MLTIRESDIENYLIKRVKSEGWKTYKFKSPAQRNVPDRIVIKPENSALIIMVEVKAPGGKPRKAQEKEFNCLRKIGVQVYVVDTYEAVDTLMEKLKT